MLTTDRVAGGALVLVGLVALWESRRLPLGTLHRPGPALDHRGCRRWNSEQEEEANWLAGALLISEEAALQIARSGEPLEEAAKRCRVSQAMITFRLNVTAAFRRVGQTRGPGVAVRRTMSARKTQG